MEEGVSTLVNYLSCWFFQDIVFCTLAITLIVGQFWKNRQALYCLIYFTAYGIVFRIFITWHIANFKPFQGWDPSWQIKLFWVVYYTGHLAFVAYFFVTVKRLWKENCWFNRVLGIVVFMFMLFYGYAVVWKPYKLLHDITRKQGTSADMRQE